MQMMTNIAFVVLCVFFAVIAAGSVYLNLFCDNNKEV